MSKDSALVRKLKRNLVKLSEENLLNFHYIMESKRKSEECAKQDNILFRDVHLEELQIHTRIYAKNVLEINYLFEQLGYNEINCNLN